MESNRSASAWGVGLRIPDARCLGTWRLRTVEGELPWSDKASSEAARRERLKEIDASLPKGDATGILSNQGNPTEGGDISRVSSLGILSLKRCAQGVSGKLTSLSRA